MGPSHGARHNHLTLPTGSDKDAILDLITSRSNKQRVEICQAYKSQYGKVTAEMSPDPNPKRCILHPRGMLRGQRHLSPFLLLLVLPQDLIADLKYELTGKFERLIVSLMRPPAYSDAKEIKDAIAVRAEQPLGPLWGRPRLSPLLTGLCVCAQRASARTRSASLRSSPPAPTRRFTTWWLPTRTVRVGEGQG